MLRDQLRENAAVLRKDVQLLVIPMGEIVTCCIDFFSVVGHIRAVPLKAARGLRGAHSQHDGGHAGGGHEDFNGHVVLHGADQVPRHGEKILAGLEVECGQHTLHMAPAACVKLVAVERLLHERLFLLVRVPWPQQTEILLQQAPWRCKGLCPCLGILLVQPSTAERIGNKHHDHCNRNTLPWSKQQAGTILGHGLQVCKPLHQLLLYALQLLFLQGVALSSCGIKVCILLLLGNYLGIILFIQTLQSICTHAYKAQEGQRHQPARPHGEREPPHVSPCRLAITAS
mmetsp:Transcript_7732/g.20607  ORF Transcript_7732/g.20607 Transcript_7732/m.20607 type:complete len:286 (-) Transcript_7732:33-890(-)